MADPTQRQVPKGQRRGAAQEQQQFLQDSAPAPLPPEAPEPTPEQQGLVDPDFGDASEMLFGPTDVPDEDPLTPVNPSPRPTGPFGPSPAMFRMMDDPRVSADLRGIIQMAIAVEAVNRGMRVD